MRYSWRPGTEHVVDMPAASAANRAAAARVTTQSSRKMAGAAQTMDEALDVIICACQRAIVEAVNGL